MSLHTAIGNAPGCGEWHDDGECKGQAAEIPSGRRIRYMSKEIKACVIMSYIITVSFRRLSIRKLKRDR